MTVREPLPMIQVLHWDIQGQFKLVENYGGDPFSPYYKGLGLGAERATVTYELLLFNKLINRMKKMAS